MGERSEMGTVPKSAQHTVQGISEDVHDLAFEMAADDVLTAWRVRNAALMVAASFVAEENHQRTQMLARMVAAEQAAERLRTGLTIAGKYRYACFADAPSPSVHHAVSEKVLTDCLWHGEGCDDWWMTVDPEVVAAASTTATPDQPAQVTDVDSPEGSTDG